MPVCPCCQRPDLSTRQIRRHLAIRRRALGAHLDAMNEDEELALGEDDEDGDEDESDDDALLNGGGPAHDEDGLAPRGNSPALNDDALAPCHDSPALDDIEPAPNDAGPRWGEVDLEALVAREDENIDLEPVGDPDDMDMDDPDDLFVPPPAVPPAPGVLRNPPVAIEEWDDEREFDIPTPPESESEDEAPVGGADRDPEFNEHEEAVREMNEGELWEILREHLGDIAREEWIDLYNRHLTDQDRATLKFSAARLRTHLSRSVYEDLRQTICAELGLSSHFVVWFRLKVLSNLESVAYDCCIDSCICYLGKYRDLDRCPFCDNPRYNAAGKPRRTFQYVPLIPQLSGLFQSAQSIKNMRHRTRHEAHRAAEPGKFEDIFDGEIYRTLRNTKVFEEHEYRHFDNPDDIALGFGTDGFSLYKRWRHKGSSTAWPLILINYNLHPSIRTRLENVICVGVIPGPKECKDISSFLIPLIEELLKLAEGVEMSKVASDEDDLDGNGTYFVLRAFLILLFGDIPAISKILMLKGHGSITPCRTCTIQGVPCQLPNSVVYYVPLTGPGEDLSQPDDLILRNHQSFLTFYEQLEREQGVGARAEIAQQSGLNGRPVFARLSSIDLSSCAPYEMMHLIFENLVPNMIHHWKGTFKWIDIDDQVYHIDRDSWKLIGNLTTQATRTIPSQFVSTLPNIDTDMGLYKAEAFSFWFTYLAPILLNGRLDQEHYLHFLEMREVIVWCLQFEITDAQVDALEEKINQWVQDYERLYYRYDHDRLPACVLTIHALLHMPHYIRQAGPLPCSWSFVVERFCGHLLRPTVANRVRPYDTLNNFVRRRAQMQIVSHVHSMPELLRTPTRLTLQAGELISSKEKIYDFLPDYVLGQPVRRVHHAPDALKRQMCKYFGVVEGPPHGQGPRPTRQELLDKIDWDTLVRHGRFRMASMGDRVRTADLIRNDGIARDNSFIRYELLPDGNADRPNARDRAIRRIYYGRVRDVFYVEFVRDPATNTRVPYLLIRVEECNTGGLDATDPENPIVTYNRLDTPDIINLGTVHAAIGRVKIGGRNTWGIVDRSRGARTQFNDDEGAPDLELE